MFTSILPRNFLLLLLAALVLSGCVSTEELQKRRQAKLEKEQITALAPSNKTTHQAFRQTKTWKTKVYRDDAALALATAENIRVRIIVAEQRGQLFVHDLIGLDFPVSTGRKTHPTPTGDFKIIAKELKHHSNLYGKILDADGNVVNGNAEAKKDTPGEGNYFEGAPMPFFMRLTNEGVGMHVGVVPGYAASHGCIRLPKAVAPKIYEMAGLGTPVSIAEKS